MQPYLRSPPPPPLKISEAQSAPARPTGLVATAGDQSVTLSWTDPGDSTITRYAYQVNHTNTGTGKLSGWSQETKIPGSDSSTTSHTFTGLTNGKEYRYRILAVSANGQSKPGPGAAPYYLSATPQGAEPPPVSNFWVERVCDHHFRVRWHRVSGATGYDLNLSGNHRKSWARKMTNKNYNAWQFSQWNKDKTYWFAIRAVNAHGASAWTNVQSVAPPCPVEGLQASYASNGDVSVSWNAAKRASGYDVNFSSDAGKSWERMGSNVNATTYSFKKDPNALPWNPNFLVAVQSRKGGMTSPWRNAPIVPVKLTASDITTTTATLTLANHSGQWLYKRTAPGGDDTCHSVAAGTATASLSSLNADTSYTYKAYADAGCGISDEIASVTLHTQLAVSNLDQAVSQYSCTVNANSWCAAGFTTGTSAAGYTLTEVTAKFADKIDAIDNIELGDIVVSLHADNAGVPASVALATLSGSNPDTAGEYTYTCSGSGCALATSATYFIQFKSTDGTGNNNLYELLATDADDETQTPSGNGWSLANGTDNYKVDGQQWISEYPEASLIKISAAVNP